MFGAAFWRRLNAPQHHKSHAPPPTGQANVVDGPLTTQECGRWSIDDINKKADPVWVGFLVKVFRRCPTLPRGLPRSTIGAEGLNFRVRDGTGCFPFAMAAATLWSCPARVRPCPQNRTVDAKHSRRLCVCQALGLLVPVSCTPCGASTSGLSTQSSGWGPYPLMVAGGLILRRVSRLDAFSGYPSRT